MLKQLSHAMSDGRIRQISLSDRCRSQRESVIRQTDTATRHFPTAVEGHQSSGFCVGVCIRLSRPACQPELVNRAVVCAQVPHE